MALFGGEGINFPGAAGNFAGMLPGAFAITPFAGKGELDQTGGFLAGGGWAQPPGSGQYPPGFGLPAQLAGGPSLFPIPKDINKGEVKGKIGGVQGGSRNDLSKPYGGLQGMPQAMGPSIPGFDMGNMAPFNERLVANAALNPMFGGEGGRQNFTNAVTNPIEFLLGGEGGKKEFQNINIEDLLKGGR